MTKLPLPLLAAALLTACSSSEPSGDAKKAADSPKATPESGASAAVSIQPNPSGAAAASALVAPGTSAAPGASAAPTASAAAAAAAPDLGPPVCTRSNEKVWGSGANKLTGLTTKRIDKKLAIGFAFGTDPRVLVIDKDGSAKVLKVKMGEKATVPDPKEGYRALLRVSPSSLKGDSARAFIDYRDDYKDKRRRVSCGPADADENFLAFEGTSWLDMEPKPTGEDKKKLFSWKKLGGYVELRDCRTFVSLRSNETWALGSVLRGTEKEDGTNEWKVVFLVDFGKSDEEIVLHETTLKGDPPKLLTYEIPTSRRAGDKGMVIATRFGGTLMVGVLGANKALKRKFKTYRGFPTMPDFARDDEELILTTGIGVGNEKSLKALFIPRDTVELPAAYTNVDLTPMDASGDAEASFTSPELEVDSKGQRWISYVEGPKDKGHLRIAPLDKELKPAGRAFSVTDGEVYASESRVAALEDGRLMVAYIRTSAGKTELVTEQLTCEVKK